MMMDKEMLLKLLGAMDDTTVLKAFSHATGLGAMPDDDNDIKALKNRDDPRNRVKGWSELKFEKKPDDRPPLSSRSDYVIDKMKDEVPMTSLGMPLDDGDTSYTGGF